MFDLIIYDSNKRKEVNKKIKEKGDFLTKNDNLSIICPIKTCRYWRSNNSSLKILLSRSQLITEPPEFKVAAVRGSNEEDYFKHHISSSFRKIYDVNLRKNSVTSLTSGIEQMKAKYV